MLSFSLVAEALMGLIYHRPSGENFSFGLLESNQSVTKTETTGGQESLMLALKRADVDFE